MKNNNQLILILVGLLVLGGLGVYFVTNSSDSDSATEQVMVKDDDAMMAEDKMMEEDAMHGDLMMMEAPETAVSYMITDGTASYAVQKGWFNKPTEEVVGTTSAVTGDGWFDAENGAVSVMAKIDLVSLSTGNDNRDADVLGYFESPMAELLLELDSSDIVLGEEFTLNVPVMLEISGVKNEVVMDITGTLTADSFTATGSAASLVTDWEIELPSAAGVFTLEDDLVLSFEVSGTAK